ncbi:MAG: biopolymer transporter ExbD [Phycisphaerales bacterium]|nr:MAG: biopolymer transporter ExbD [Phycisphaerales bacterium]
MRRRIFHAPHATGKINVTPMIDVVMVLIIFYLLVGKLAGDRRPPMALPTSAASVERSPTDPIIVNVRTPASDAPARDLRVEVEQRELGPEALGVLLRTAEPGRAVLVRAPRDASWSSVAPVLHACRDAGRSVRLATEPAP